jgi:hypothetical protein
MVVTETRLHQLFVLNVALQLFDGIATWQGTKLWGEGNPMMAVVMGSLGVGVALLLFKAKACALLVFLRRCWRHREAYDALAVLAGCYAVLSFVPWMLRFVSLLDA